MNGVDGAGSYKLADSGCSWCLRCHQHVTVGLQWTVILNSPDIIAALPEMQRLPVHFQPMGEERFTFGEM